MSFSISQVARMAGVSARTLRHYDDIGLLAPASVSANGYRWYTRTELRRLQRILLLRDLHVPLPQIKDILTGEADEAGALRDHLELITAQRDRLDRIATTIMRTLDDVEGREPLPEQEFFDGLDRGRAALARVLEERYGPRAAGTVRSAAARTAHWTRADYRRVPTEAEDLYGRLARACRAGLEPTSPEALDLIAEHYEAVRAMWPADAAAYHALADLLESDPRQRAVLDSVDPDLPAWLGRGVRAYAAGRLGYG